MSFENIIGNDKVKNILQKTIDTGNILHSYLFTGVDGIGKKIFAYEFAKMILCNDENKPCNNCKSCLQFNNQNHPDFYVIDNQENSIKIDSIRYLRRKNI